MVTHLVGCAPLVVIAVIKLSSSSLFSLSFFTRLSIARLLKLSDSPPCNFNGGKTLIFYQVKKGKKCGLRYFRLFKSRKDRTLITDRYSVISFLRTACKIDHKMSKLDGIFWLILKYRYMCRMLYVFQKTDSQRKTILEQSQMTCMNWVVLKIDTIKIDKFVWFHFTVGWVDLK